MSRTTTREIVQVCTELAKLDRRWKQEILNYLETELAKPVVKRSANSASAYDWMKERGTITTAKVPTTYTQGGEK